MAIKKREFGYHSKDNGDEWWFFLAMDTDKPHELFVIVETETRETGVQRCEQRFGLIEYLSSNGRGTGKLIDLIGTLLPA